MILEDQRKTLYVGYEDLRNGNPIQIGLMDYIYFEYLCHVLPNDPTIMLGITGPIPCKGVDNPDIMILSHTRYKAEGDSLDQIIFDVIKWLQDRNLWVSHIAGFSICRSNVIEIDFTPTRDNE